MSSEHTLSSSSTVVAKEQLLSSCIGDEAVILNLDSGIYYGLNEIGNRIWQLVQQPQTVATLQASILQEYTVKPEICEQDLLALLQDLQANGLIEIIDGDAA